MKKRKSYFGAFPGIGPLTKEDKLDVHDFPEPALIAQKCVPCEGGIPPMRPDAYEPLLKHVPGWKLRGNKIAREFKFKDFIAAMKFVNKVAVIAEKEGHHPDIAIHWNRVTLTLWTHAIGGLSQNDFIVAAKVNALK